MMQVSTRTEYGMRCLLLMAKQEEGKALSLGDVSRQEHLPRPYAHQIMVRLRRAGLVKSLRGTQGGFALAKPADQISVGAILRVLEGNPFEDTCNHFNQKCDCGHLGDCSLRPVWETVARRVWEALDRVTLQHLLANERAVEQKLVTELPVINFVGNPQASLGPAA